MEEIKNIILYQNKIYRLNFIFVLFLLILKNNFIQSDGCFISNNTSIESLWLNNIICLGEKNLRYINFLTFSNKDMVLEVTAIPDLPKRIFYGIKSDGSPLFDNSQYFSSISISGQAESNNSRYEGEIFIVPINNKEYIFSIGKGNKRYAELYDLENGETVCQQLAITFLNIDQIFNVRGSSSNYKVNGNNYIFFPFINKNSNYFTFYLRKFFFHFNKFYKQ